MDLKECTGNREFNLDLILYRQQMAMLFLQEIFILQSKKPASMEMLISLLCRLMLIEGSKKDQKMYSGIGQ